MTERERKLLARLDETEFLRPMDVGGRDGSHHSATLARLARKGLAERRKSCWCTDDKASPSYNRRHPWCRCKGSCRYRRTPAGTAAIAA